MTDGARRPRWRTRALNFGRRLFHEWQTDRVPDLAAEVAFWAILSLFPALVALASVLGALDSVVGVDVATRVEENVIDALRTVLTSEADNTIAAVEDLFVESRPGLLTFSALVAVWTLSRGFAALVRALDVAYDIDEHRPWLQIRSTALVLALGSLVAAALMLTLIVVGPLLGSGEDIADAINLGDEFVFLWDVLRLPVAFLVLVAWAATIFHIAPDHHTPWRADLPGALVTTVLWLIFSGGLRVYVSVAQTGNAVFGTLGGVLIVLLWFWLLSLAVIVGGEVNEVLLHPPPEDDEGIGGRTDAVGTSWTGGSSLVQGPADRGDEGAGLDGGAPVEEEPHDRGGDHDPVRGS